MTKHEIESKLQRMGDAIEEANDLLGRRREIAALMNEVNGGATLIMQVGVNDGECWPSLDLPQLAIKEMLQCELEGIERKLSAFTWPV